MTVRQLLKVLRQDGWIKKVQKGSHLQLEHPTKKGKVTLNAILKQAGLR